MREILFRGKRVDTGEWVEGYYVKGATRHCIFRDLSRYPHYDVIPETVGQYTGLVDKNGKKIFEGDIIRYADQDDYECYLESLENPEDYAKNAFDKLWTIDKVVYGTEINYPAFDLNRHNFECNGLSELSESRCYYYEVIGNIHDNPELLEVHK